MNLKQPLIYACLGLVAGGVAMTLVKSNPAAAMKSSSSPTLSRPINLVTGSGSGLAPNLKMFDAEFANLVQSIEPSVVHIKTSAKNARTGQSSMMGEGSGVIYREDGWIITNDHVVNGADKVTVVLSNGKEYEGVVRESEDIRNDIAVVKINISGLTAAKFDMEPVRPGQFAIAVGAPFGLENTVTIGHVSATGRNSQASSGMGDIRVYNSLIQTDAPINPGNSGGPLLDVDGEVIGINTSIYSTGAMMGGEGGNVGIGFTIPSRQAALIADLLISKGSFKRGYLGVEMENMKPYELTERKLSGGVIVRSVPDSGPAKKSGLKAGDVIVRIGKETVGNDQDLLNSLIVNGPGTSVAVDYIRDGQRKTTTVTVGEPPKEMAMNSRPRTQPDLQPDNGMQDFFQNSPFGERFRNLIPDDPEPQATPQAPQTGRARLGVTIEDVSEANSKQFGVPSSTKGAIVTSIEKGSVAERLNLKVGDVITEINGNTVEGAQSLADAMKSVKPGANGSIAFSRFDGNTTSTMRLSVKF